MELEDDKTSKRILEYYKNHSLNRELPKYFLGSSISYMPEIVVENEDGEQIKESSRASSVLSNRKLEWDNGADIGYDNCGESSKKLQKSLSLPVLIGTTSNDLEKASVGVVSTSDGDNKNTNSVSSRCSSERIQNFARTLTYLKQKIGLPGAQSTPKINNELGKSSGDSTTVSSTSKGTSKTSGGTSSNIESIEEDNLCSSNTKKESETSEHVKFVREKPVINLFVTKPVTIECIDEIKKETKDIQTSVVKTNNSKSTQTDEYRKQNSIVKPKKLNKTEDNQVIVFIEHTDDEKHVQISSDIASASNCDSFEFVKAFKPVEGDNFNQLRRSQRENDLTNVVVTTTTTSGSTTNSTTQDIDQHLGVLQKLLASKKYDRATKKHYIKKIIRKIAESNFLEESSSSSDLFFPKRTVKNVTLDNKESTTDYSGSKSEEVKNCKLQSNLPWYPVGREEVYCVKRNEEQEIIPTVQNTNKRFTRFTLTNNQFSVKHDSPSETDSGNKYRNWKYEKTASEQQHENERQFPSCRNGGGDYLLDFVKSEREQQIHWINNEINHLSKLKLLLTKNQSLISSSERQTKINSETKNNLKSASTTTYKISNKKENVERNFVIETKIGDTIQNNSPRKFTIGGSSYTVNKLSNDDTEAKVQENQIAVSSNPTTTNLKINLVCSKCKETSCVCVNKNIDNVTCLVCKKNKCKCSLTESCPFCGYFNCLCKPKTSQESTNPETITPCPKCHKIICMCCYRCFWCQKKDCICPKRTEKTKPVEMKNCTCQKLKKCNCDLVAKLRETLKQLENLEDDKLPKEDNQSQTVPLKSIDATTSVLLEKEAVKAESRMLSNSASSEASLSDQLSGHSEANSLQFQDEPEDDVKDTESKIMCVCCKQENVSENMALLVSEHRYPLCHTCLKKNPGVTTVCCDSSDHICTCYTEVNTENLEKLNNKKLNRMTTGVGKEDSPPLPQQKRITADKSPRYANPKKTDHEKLKSNTDDDNKYCRCSNGMPCDVCTSKLSKTAKGKNSIAYKVLLEEKSLGKFNASVEEVEELRKRPSLEEIHIQVPYLDKNRKNKENWNNQNKEGIDIHIKKFNKQSYDMLDQKQTSTSTLQAFLKNNRPDFIEKANTRRQTINESKEVREENKDANKMKVLEEIAKEKEVKKLFTGRQMKSLTEKTYKKLPEVQNKLKERREKQLRDANKLIVDLFSRKVQCSVLKGKRNFPIDMNVISLSCTTSATKN